MKAKIALLTINSLFFLFAILYLTTGSLETFPTDEQTEKVQIVIGIFAIILLINALIILKRINTH